jgi:hypothetical protein
VSLSLRFCIPRIQGLRGAGLANEMHPWAKAWIASQMLDAHCLHPAWGLNPRHYHKYFRTSRADWLSNALLAHSLPRYRFTERDYIATGATSFDEAIRIWADALDLRQKRAWILEVDGMWGGYGPIMTARPFLRLQLMQARGSARNLFDFERVTPSEKIRIAVHIRLGDFDRAAPHDETRGKFNRSIPLEWYIAVCRELQAKLGKGVVSFTLLTDGTPEETALFEREFTPYTSRHLHNTVCSDLLLLSSADLLVCSPSSFSMMAAFLSASPYIWFKPQLTVIGGFLSVWGHEPQQQRDGSPTRRAVETARASGRPAEGRGIAVGMTGALPECLIASCLTAYQRRNQANDLLLYGVCSDSQSLQNGHTRNRSTVVATESECLSI